MINLELQQQINNINSNLSILSLQLLNCSILLYKKIPQKSIDYAPFDNAIVNFTYTPPQLQYDFYFGQNQIQQVITYYVGNVNTILALLIDSGLESQFTPKINQLNSSIAQLNNFATSLYNGSNSKIISYTVPYPMSIRSALLLNNLTLDNMALVILFNMNTINTVNYIDVGTVLILL